MDIINSTLGVHPVHITTDAPSSFIPFCSLGGNMTAVGKIFPNFPVPVCSRFEPFLLNDQVVIVNIILFHNDQNDVLELLQTGY